MEEGGVETTVVEEEEEERRREKRRRRERVKRYQPSSDVSLVGREQEGLAWPGGHRLHLSRSGKEPQN
jgi:hypothetical protein